ncbi:hypothetical protein QA645_00830 [Bradyrhizobium sp. CIAT3101]|uniref:hypothetical protein n=1 Tax=Bradyrhizobium sp. CIAT3101 TaxID=439387 RepID=UPI0024B05B89|nr:hypothetical protein [Bradyrhizobium sp. CIAT3101]WFU81329.1 hypothetical protein QA645_00830 [Bradyrhizobium sp. CIAT3101]
MLGGLSSEQSFAANVYLHKGEGGTGIDAELQLGEADQFNLALIGFRNVGASQQVQLGLFIGGDNRGFGPLNASKTVAPTRYISSTRSL